MPPASRPRSRSPRRASPARRACAPPNPVNSPAASPQPNAALFHPGRTATSSASRIRRLDDCAQNATVVGGSRRAFHPPRKSPLPHATAAPRPNSPPADIPAQPAPGLLPVISVVVQLERDGRVERLVRVRPIGVAVHAAVSVLIGTG